MLLGRRALMLGGAFALTMPRCARAQQSAALREIAVRNGIAFGGAIGARGFADSSYRALLQQQCAIVTPENALKWQALSPAPGRLVFDEADRIVNWATKAGLDVRGHTLFWPRQDRLPGWVNEYDFGSKPVDECDLLVGRHVVAVAKRYAGRIRSFDVVNEAVDPATGGLRESVLSRASGGLGRLIALAFQLAREAAPKAELVYNDYMDWGEGSAKHRDGVLRLLEAMRKGGIPVDALGIQAHVTAASDMNVVTRRERDWRLFLDEVTGMGYKLLVTEFDVDDRELSGSPAERDLKVGDYGKAYAEILLSYPQLTSFVVWGLSDKYSWLDSFRPRADRQAKRGCPYDAGLQEKPLRSALAATLAVAPRRVPLKRV